MADPIVTLTTDFGAASPYVAAMKGVILGINPAARIVDLSHQVPPQDIRYVDWFLAATIPCFPGGVIHIVVVDPGVGTERALLYVEVDGQRLLLPDNGCWTTLARAAAPNVRRLTETRFWRQPISATFHGRDILAPVAAHLSLGAPPASLGPIVSEWTTLDLPPARTGANCVMGEVMFVDPFGNLISNIPGAMVPSPPDLLRVGKKSFRRKFRWVRTYAEAEPGQLVALVSSCGNVELAVVEGSAAQRVKASVGTDVTIGWAR